MTQILDKNSLELVVKEAELLHSQAAIEQRIQLMSQEISQILEHEFPICLTVMLGGLLFSAQLVMRLQFPLELDYIHASRYGAHTQGGSLQWQKKPKLCLEGRKILIMDDILDEGITLQAIIDYCYQAGAEKVYTAVLVDKIRPRTGLKQADFVGLHVPDRYVFGYGMDYKGYLRHLTAIYAVKGL
jgi:hypoxanthine phosphoribosyltransferase